MVGRRRLSASSSEACYQSFLKAMGAPDRATDGVRSGFVTVAVASCSGLAALSRTVGRRLSFIRATTDVAALLGRLAAVRYGGYVVSRDAIEPFQAESGWADWRAIAIGHEMCSGCTMPEGVTIEGDGLRVDLMKTTSAGEMRRRLCSSFAHLRFDLALNRADEVRYRQKRDLPLIVRPRYSFALEPDEAFERVDDLYAFDPWRNLDLLAVHASAASN